MNKFLTRLALLWKHYDIKQGERLYLRRFFLWRSKYFNIFLHNIRLPDPDRHPHDHPWSFLGLVLWGGYKEMRFSAGGRKRLEHRKRGRLALRKATDIHKIVEVQPNTWTLIITGCYARAWGFWKFSKGKKRWVLWTKYLKIKGKPPEID